MTYAPASAELTRCYHALNLSKTQCDTLMRQTAARLEEEDPNLAIDDILKKLRKKANLLMAHSPTSLSSFNRKAAWAAINDSHGMLKGCDSMAQSLVNTATPRLLNTLKHALVNQCLYLLEKKALEQQLKTLTSHLEPTTPTTHSYGLFAPLTNKCASSHVTDRPSTLRH